MKEKVILFAYSEGGHRAKMKKLLTHLDNECSPIHTMKKISLYENGDYIDSIETKYEIPSLRDKYTKIKTILNIMAQSYKIILLLNKIKKEYDVKVLISTGAGISLLPTIYFKYLNNTKIIYLETDSRFETKSLTGKIMHRFSDKFYVPHKSLLKLYKKSIYSGQL